MSGRGEKIFDERWMLLVASQCNLSDGWMDCVAATASMRSERHPPRSTDNSRSVVERTSPVTTNLETKKLFPNCWGVTRFQSLSRHARHALQSPIQYKQGGLVLYVQMMMIVRISLQEQKKEQRDTKRSSEIRTPHPPTHPSSPLIV